MSYAKRRHVSLQKLATQTLVFVKITDTYGTHTEISISNI